MDNLSPISLKYVAYALKLRWRVALAVAALLFIALAACVLTLQPKYTSTTVVLLAPAAEGLAERSTGPGGMTDPVFIRSETAILASDELSRAVVERLKLWTVPEFQPQPGLMERMGLSEDMSGGVRDDDSSRYGLSPQEVLLDHAVRTYQDQLSVFNDGRSKTVEISFSASAPREAANIANAHAEAYLREQSTRRLRAQQQAIEWLAREVDARAEEARAADAQVQQYQLQHGIVSTNDVTLVEQRLAQLSTQLGEARRQLSTQTALLAEIRQILSGGDPGNAAALITDAPLQTLLQSRVQAEADIASLEKRLAPSHPMLVKQRDELASLNDALNKQLQRLENAATSSASWWQRQVNDLNASVSHETSNKVRQDRVVAALPALMTQAQVKRTVFETVLSRYQTLLAERGFLAPAASIVSRAVASARPSFPKTGLFLVLAAMISMFAGAVTAFAWQFRRSTAMGLACNGARESQGVVHGS